MAMPFNMLAHLTCLHVAYFLFALVALKNLEVQGGSSAFSIQHPLPPGAGVTIQQAETAC